MTEIRRQCEDWQRDATKALATGRAGAAINAYEAHGMVQAAETRELARADLVDRWDAERIAGPDQARIHLTHTKDRKSTRMNSRHSCASRMTYCACKITNQTI